MADLGNKVYIITRGCYSDYHICAVTLEEDRAKKLATLYSDGYEKAKIETYDVDETVELHKYGVMFDSKSWRFIRCKKDHYGDIYEAGLIDDYSEYDEVTFWVKAKDERHALKIAQDKLAEYKAKKEGVV